MLTKEVVAGVKLQNQTLLLPLLLNLEGNGNEVEIKIEVIEPFFPEWKLLVTSFYGEEFHMLKVSFSFFTAGLSRTHQNTTTNNNQPWQR